MGLSNGKGDADDQSGADPLAGLRQADGLRVDVPHLVGDSGPQVIPQVWLILTPPSLIVLTGIAMFPLFAVTTPYAYRGRHRA